MGLLDGVFEELSPFLIRVFSDGLLTITTRTSVYDQRTGVDVVTESTADIAVLPGLPKTAEETAPGTAKIAAEVVFLVAQVDLDAASITLKPQMIVAYEAKDYTIVTTEPIRSGDAITLVRIYANSV